MQEFQLVRGQNVKGIFSIANLMHSRSRYLCVLNDMSQTKVEPHINDMSADSLGYCSFRSKSSVQTQSSEGFFIWTSDAIYQCVPDVS